MLERYKIKYYKSSPYIPQANRAMEAANKNIKKILSKMIKTHRDWANKLPFALWGYRTIVRTSMGATPFSLVYGTEAVLSIEVEMKSLRVIVEADLTEAKWVEQRLAQLNLIDSKRLKELYHTQLYQRRIVRAFDKTVRQYEIKVGDLVLRQAKQNLSDPREKF